MNGASEEKPANHPNECRNDMGPFAAKQLICRGFSFNEDAQDHNACRVNEKGGVPQ
jgi:hypothetical protein